MTSASELFYQRRSRAGRANPDLFLDVSSSTSDRNFHLNYNRRHHSHHNHNRHDVYGCDTLRRSPHSRHSCHRPFSIPERASFRVEQGTSHSVPNSNVDVEVSSATSRPDLTRNDRLPGAVLLARARLLERLRGVSLSANRHNGRASYGTSSQEYTHGEDLGVDDAGVGGPGISTVMFSGPSPPADTTSEIERQRFVNQSNKKKPPGLTPDALDCLRSEIFSISGNRVEGEASQLPQASWDCSICLESFMEGDRLIRLPCEHRFHSACLDPWVRNCGDCPYCRRDIIVSSEKL